MTEFLRNAARLTTAILVGWVLVGPAQCETLVSSDFNTRLILAFRVAEQPLKELLPPGWELNPIAAGPNKGANVTVGFVDRVLNMDADGKPIAGGRDRYAAVVVPVKQSSGDRALNFVMRLYTGNERILPGVYSTSVLADVARTSSEEGANVDPGMIADAWQVRENVGGGNITVNLKYRRGTLTRSLVEQKVSSPVRANFFRIYRTDQATDVVRSVPLGIDRIENLSLKIDLPEFRDIFTGSEELIGISVMPWGLRQIYLP